MGVTVIEQSQRADGTWDVLYELDGNHYQIIGCPKDPDGQDFDLYVYEMAAKQNEARDEMEVI